jgi:hypothetical protein
VIFVRIDLHGLLDMCEMWMVWNDADDRIMDHVLYQWKKLETGLDKTSWGAGSGKYDAAGPSGFIVYRGVLVRWA